MKMLVLDLAVWPEFYEFVAGGERHFIETCKRWVRRGHEVHVLTTNTGSQFLRMSNLRSYTHVVNLPFEEALCRTSFGLTVLYTLYALKAYNLWRAYLVHHNFDIVCTISGFACDVVPAALISRENDSKLVVYAHALIPSPLSRTYQRFLPNLLVWFSQQITLMVIKKIAHLIYACPIDAEKLAVMGIPKKRIAVIHNAVNHALIQQIDPADVKYDACFVGRVTPTKGVTDLVEVWSEVCREIPTATIVIIGGGGAKGYICKFVSSIRESGLWNRIICVGPVDEKRKYALMKSSRVFVFPSYEEGWGITVCEAMACGLPVVAYDLPAYKHVFKQGIITVPVGNKKKLAEEVMRTLRDDHLRQILSQEAMIQATQYNWDIIAESELKSLEE